MEHYQIIDPIEELWLERLFGFVHHVFLDGLIIVAHRLRSSESHLRLSLDSRGTNVGRHDDDCVAEVPPQAVSQSTFLEDLQHDLNNIWMGF